MTPREAADSLPHRAVPIDPNRSDAELARDRRHRWRCSCGHVEIAVDEDQLRVQANRHHADRHQEGRR